MRVVGQKFWMWMSLWVFSPFAKSGVAAGQPQDKKSPTSAETVRPERHTTAGQDIPKKDDTKNKTKVTASVPNRKTANTPKKDGGKITPNTPKKDGGKVTSETRLKTTSKSAPVFPKKDARKVAPNTPKKDGGKPDVTR